MQEENKLHGVYTKVSSTPVMYVLVSIFELLTANGLVGL
jgi:hypothetical protein